MSIILNREVSASVMVKLFGITNPLTQLHYSMPKAKRSLERATEEPTPFSLEGITSHNSGSASFYNYDNYANSAIATK